MDYKIKQEDKDFLELCGLKLWEELMEENGEAFETDRDKIFLAMKIAIRCVDLRRRWGYLAIEEFVDDRCGLGKDEVPLWEYLRPSVWMLIETTGEEMLGRQVKHCLMTLLAAYKYTGYKAIQGFVYLTGALMVLTVERGVRALEYFRSLVPDKYQESFDDYFRPVIEQWKEERLSYDDQTED